VATIVPFRLQWLISVLYRLLLSCQNLLVCLCVFSGSWKGIWFCWREYACNV